MVKQNQILFSIFLIINLIFLSSNLFAEKNINTFEYLKLEINNQVSFDVPIEYKQYIVNVNLISYFFPQTINGAQYLNSFNSNFNYKFINNTGINSLKFYFDKNNIKIKNLVKNNFIVESTVTRPKIYSKIIYPIKNISKENQQYLKFTGLINTNSKIRNQASKLANGEDDVFIIASKIAQWVQSDIEYNLSTISALPNQTSTEVFATKKGVCKEITNLYISMMRSLGIPARVVTGYAWTNSQEIIDLVGSNWGGHAWAEVLIGDKWVPFDLTYNEYGYVDASHIVIDKSVEIRKNGVETLTTTNSINGNSKANIKNLKINNSFIVIDKKDNIYDLGFEINVTGVKKIGFGSYGYIKANIKNKDDFYKILFLSLSKITEVTPIGKLSKMIIFKPNEEKNIYYKFKLVDNLSNNYIYTFPFLIYNENIKENFNITSKSNFVKLKLEDLPYQINTTIKSYTNNSIKFNCNFTIQNPLNLIKCSIKNTNNFILKDVKICKNNLNCQIINLNLNEEKLLIFKTSNFNETINFKYKQLIKKQFVEFLKPKIIYNKKLIGNILDLNLYISNFDNNTNLNIYLNNKLIENIKDKEKNLQIKLKEKNNIIRFTSFYNNILIENISFNQTIAKRYVKGVFEKNIEKIQNNQDNLIDKIIKFFLNFFKF